MGTFCWFNNNNNNSNTSSRLLHPLSPSNSHTVHQKLAIKGSTKPYYKYEPPSVLQNFSYKLYYDQTIILDQTTHNSRQDTIILDKSIIEAHLIHVAIPNTHNFHTIITKKF